jgi:hypothetical protein
LALQVWALGEVVRSSSTSCTSRRRAYDPTGVNRR